MLFDELKSVAASQLMTKKNVFICTLNIIHMTRPLGFFREYLRSPSNEPELSALCNLNQQPIGINRMIVAFQRTQNMKNILFLRRFRELLIQKFCRYSASTGDIDCAQIPMYGVRT
jgi:hypothetical protein